MQRSGYLRVKYWCLTHFTHPGFPWSFSVAGPVVVIHVTWVSHSIIFSSIHFSSFVSSDRVRPLQLRCNLLLAVSAYKNTIQTQCIVCDYFSQSKPRTLISDQWQSLFVVVYNSINTVWGLQLVEDRRHSNTASHWSVEVTWPQYWPLIGHRILEARGTHRPASKGCSHQ